jgi:hypothetical protein
MSTAQSLARIGAATFIGTVRLIASTLLHTLGSDPPDARQPSPSTRRWLALR